MLRLIIIFSLFVMLFSNISYLCVYIILKIIESFKILRFLDCYLYALTW